MQNNYINKQQREIVSEAIESGGVPNPTTPGIWGTPKEETEDALRFVRADKFPKKDGLYFVRRTNKLGMYLVDFSTKDGWNESNVHQSPRAFEWLEEKEFTPLEEKRWSFQFNSQEENDAWLQYEYNRKKGEEEKKGEAAEEWVKRQVNELSFSTYVSNDGETEDVIKASDGSPLIREYAQQLQPLPLSTDVTEGLMHEQLVIEAMGMYPLDKNSFEKNVTIRAQREAASKGWDAGFQRGVYINDDKPQGQIEPDDKTTFLTQFK